MINRIRKFTCRLPPLRGHWCLLVVVVIAQVQLPIPVAHDHESVESSEMLAAHVDLRHDGQHDDESGFHWHWVLPAQIDDHDSGDDQSLPLPADVLDAGAIASARSNTSAAWGTDFVPTSVSWDGFPARLADVPMTRKRSLLDVSPLSSATFSCAVLCVIRC